MIILKNVRYATSMMAITLTPLEEKQFARKIEKWLLKNYSIIIDVKTE